ncbi:MAG TPA: NAD(P)/FAD-dependent oxidoreductase [Micromonosporaceae bacterium]
MARTPLARMLRRIAAEHRIAAELHASPEQVHLSRRELLARAAVVGAAAAVGSSLSWPRDARAAAGSPRIAIVGGGISGLVAALQLQDYGVAATVYEANDRVGGRMFSSTAGSYWYGGQVSEWGGELIDTNHKLIQTLAKRFSLRLDDLIGAEPSHAEPTYYFGGTYYPYSQASSDFKPVHQAIQNDMQSFTWPVLYNSNPTPEGVALSNLTVYDWIETRVPGGHSSNFGKLLDVAYNIEYGAETTAQSSLNLLGLLAYQPSPGNFSIFGLSDERYHIGGGNQQLPGAIAAALPANSVQLGWQLTALAQNADGTQTLTFVSAGTTKTVMADHTILAVPLGVLKRLDLSAAGFDTMKSAQISAMGMGHNCKLQLQFGNRIWNGPGAWPGISSGETYTDAGYQCTWDVSRAQSGNQGILVDYTGGATAAQFNPNGPFLTSSSNQVRRYAQTFLGQLEPVFPGIAGQWNGKATMSAWHTNPYSWGAYSYWPIGYPHRYAGYEAVRQGNVHFAGEHCSINFQGFMEGGAEEGQRAANEILADLGK